MTEIPHTSFLNKYNQESKRLNVLTESFPYCTHSTDYHPPMKLWEGNVFSRVCHSVWRSPYMWQLSSYVLDFTVHGLPASPTLDIRHGTPLDIRHGPALPPNIRHAPPRTSYMEPPVSDIWWPSLKTC